MLNRLSKHHDHTGATVNQDAESETDSEPTNRSISTGTVVKRYAARHHLYSKFRKSKDISMYSAKERFEFLGTQKNSNVNLLKSNKVCVKNSVENFHNPVDVDELSLYGGTTFSQNHQTEYFDKISSIANLRSAKRGLGFKSNMINGEVICNSSRNVEQCSPTFLDNDVIIGKVRSLSKDKYDNKKMVKEKKIGNLTRNISFKKGKSCKTKQDVINISPLKKRLKSLSKNDGNFGLLPER